MLGTARQVKQVGGGIEGNRWMKMGTSEGKGGLGELVDMGKEEAIDDVFSDASGTPKAVRLLERSLSASCVDKRKGASSRGDMFRRDPLQRAQYGNLLSWTAGGNKMDGVESMEEES